MIKRDEVSYAPFSGQVEIDALPQQFRRDGSGTGKGLLEGEVRVLRCVAHPFDEVEAATREEVGATETDLAIFQQFYLALKEVIVTRFKSGEVDAVGYEHGTVRAFDTCESLECWNGQMVKVCDEGGMEAVVSELGPENILVTVNHGGGAVAQMGRERRACIDGLGDLFGGGVVMTEGHGNTALDEGFDKGNGPGKFGGDGDIEDTALSSFVEFVEVAEQRGLYVFDGVGTPGSVQSGDVGAFEVEAGGCRSDDGIGEGLDIGATSFFHVVDGTGDEGGYPVGNAPGGHVVGDGAKVLGADGGALEVDAIYTVDLDVEKERRDDGVRGADGFVACCGCDVTDFAVDHYDVEGFTFAKKFTAYEGCIGHR